MTNETTLERGQYLEPLGEKVISGAKMIASHRNEIYQGVKKGIRDSLPHSAVGFGARLLSGNIFKAVELVPAAGVISVIGTAAYTASKEYSYTRNENLIGFRKRYVTDFDARVARLNNEFGDVKSIKGKVWNLFKTAYNESGGRVESMVVSTTLTLGADLGARGLKALSLMTASEVRAKYLQACGNNETEARKLMASDFAKASLAHKVGSFGERAEYTAVGLALFRAMKADTASERQVAWKAVKDKRNDKLIRVASIAGIVAIKSTKAFLKFSGGVLIAKELGDAVHFVAKVKNNISFVFHSPNSADGHFMTLARSAKKAADVTQYTVPVEQVTAEPINIEGQTAMLGSDMNLNSGGGYEFVDLRTNITQPVMASITPSGAAVVALESKVAGLSALSAVKLNSINDLVAASAQYREVSSVLGQTVKSSMAADGRLNVTVGDVLMGMNDKEALATINNAGGLLKLASDREASLSLVSSLKQSMSPTYSQFEVGKNGVGTLWEALQKGGIDPTKAGSASEFMDKVFPKLNSVADPQSREAILKAFGSYDNLNNVSFAQVLSDHDLKGTRGFWLVMNGDVISVRQSAGLNVEAGNFDQAVSSYKSLEAMNGKTAMAGVADFASNQKQLSPNLLPLNAASSDTGPVYDMVQQPDGSVIPVLRPRPQIPVAVVSSSVPVAPKVESPVAVVTVKPNVTIDEGPKYNMVQQPDGSVVPVLVTKAKTVVNAQPVTTVVEPTVKPPEQATVPVVKPVDQTQTIRTGVTYIPGVAEAAAPAPKEVVWGESTYMIGSYDIRSGNPVRLQSSKFGNIFAFENFDGKNVNGGYVDVKFIFSEDHGRPEDNAFSWYVNNKGGLVFEAHTGWSKFNSNIKGPVEGLRMFGEGGNFRGPQVGYYQLTGDSGKLSQLSVLDPQFELKSLTDSAKGSIKYVDGSYVLNSEIKPDSLMGIDYRDIGGGPGTVTIIGCSQSHIEAAKDLVDNFESVISMGGRKDLQDLLRIIKDPVAKDKSVEDAVNKLISELEKAYKNDSATMNLIARIKDLWNQKNENPWSYGRTIWTFQTSN